MRRNGNAVSQHIRWSESYRRQAGAGSQGRLLRGISEFQSREMGTRA